MYLTNKSDRYVNEYFFRNHAMSFLYTVWFCLRRLAFVMCFFITYNDAFNHYQCLLGLLLIQTFYLAYIYEYSPHLEPIFNYLERFNELMIVFILYAMIGIISSCGFGILSFITQWTVGYFTTLLIVIVIVVNFVFMLCENFTKLKIIWRKRKYKQKKKKRVKKRQLPGVGDQKFEKLETQCSTNRFKTDG